MDMDLLYLHCQLNYRDLISSFFDTKMCQTIW